MSPRKTIEKNVDGKYSLTRSPIDRQVYSNIYPDVNQEKENMYNSSPEVPPEKGFSDRPSPRKNNSPSNTDNMQDAANVLKRRTVRDQQNLMDRPQDSGYQNISPNKGYHENSDMEMETDDDDDTNYPHKLGQKTSEKVLPGIKNEIHLSPKSNRSVDFAKARGRIDQPQMQHQRMYPPINTPKPSNFFPAPIYLIIILVIVIVISLVYLIFSFFAPGSSNVNDQLNATTLVLNLKSEFENQPKLTFRIIHNALKGTLKPQPESPAIILLLATNGSLTVCKNFAHKLIKSLSVHEYTVGISGEKYKLANANVAKVDIEKIIDKTLKIGLLGSVLIEDLDQIPGQVATILYKYSDHENAHFKKAVFVMTVNYNKAIGSLSDSKEWDKAAYDHLLSVWTDIGVDQVTPLLTRLTVSVAVITTKTL